MKNREKPIRPQWEGSPPMPPLAERQRQYQEMLDRMSPEERKAHFDGVRKVQAAINKDRLKWGLVFVSFVVAALWIAVKILGWLWSLLA